MTWKLIIEILLLVLLLIAAGYGLLVSRRYYRACRYVRKMLSELCPEAAREVPVTDLDAALRLWRQEMIDRHVKPSNEQKMKFKTLQNQVNPHFLYNTLESIRAVAVCDGEEGLPQIAAMTEALARYFRYNISNRNDMVTLEEEINNIEQYMMIQRFRFYDRFDLEVSYMNCEPYVHEIMIPKLLLQPIVENSIFHGLEGKMEKGRIGITVTDMAGKIIISVEDNGIGMADDRLFELQEKIRQKDLVLGDDESSHNGVALWQINQQIQTLFGEEYGMYIYSTLNVGTTVELVLPRINRASEGG